MYIEKDLVRVAKRENNTKRKYLVVNQLQAKHIPVKPGLALNMFDQLAEKVGKAYQNESLLLIGFAETATAIGARLAINLKSFYMQTTRETEKNAGYLYFSESHSHATEQKLIKDDIDKYIDKIQRVIFVEDEVTTGNTIMNIINIMDRLYPGKVSFSVASLLNGMDEAALADYENKNIGIHYLVKTDHSSYADRVEGYLGDGQYHLKNIADTKPEKEFTALNGYMNARHLISGEKYESACEKLWKQISEESKILGKERILVLGTEEFMYPAIYTAARLEREGKDVLCHSTTRSPIVVSSENDYPLHDRYELASLYDSERVTYIYDIGRYDTVIIITDSGMISKKGKNTLVNAIEKCGNTNILLYRWCDK